ncbi:MAG: hypothetical protein OEW98_00145 [Betaproteobacteria bacterium]|nr:hypothetical protein [Betaproteobacteria bacterium]
MDDFEAFWRAYPRRVGKGEARKVWTRLQPTAETLAAMLAAIAWQRQTDQWRRDGGQFIPHPSTWLRQERWMDEPVEALPLLTSGDSRTGQTMEAAKQALRARLERGNDEQTTSGRGDGDRERLGAAGLGPPREIVQGGLRRVR